MAIARAHLHRSQSHYRFSSYPSWVTRYVIQYPGQFLHQQIKRRLQQNWEAIFSCCLDETATAAYVSFIIAPDGVTWKRLHGGRSPSTVPACKLKRGFRSVAEVSKVYRQVLAVATSQPVERIFPFPTGTDCSTKPEGTASGSQRVITAIAHRS